MNSKFHAFHTKMHRIHKQQRDACCPELALKRHFMRYHRFFIFSPFFLLTFIAMAYLIAGKLRFNGLAPLWGSPLGSATPSPT